MRRLWELLGNNRIPQSILDSTVFIETQTPLQAVKLKYTRGKGFIFGRYILTAGHLLIPAISPEISDPAQYAKLHFPISCRVSRTGDEWLSASLLMVSDIREEDVALLAFPEKFSETRPQIKINLAEIVDNELIYYVGHKKDSHKKIIKRGRVVAQLADYDHALTFKLAKKGADNIVMKGESGSPVFRQKTHELVGILVSAGAGEDNRMGFFVEIGRVINYIKREAKIDLAQL